MNGRELSNGISDINLTPEKTQPDQRCGSKRQVESYHRTLSRLPYQQTKLSFQIRAGNLCHAAGISWSD